MSLGIAEVALPISFKLSNIEATEGGRRQAEIERQAKYKNKIGVAKHLDSGQAGIQATGTARFWNSSMSSFIQQQGKDRAARALESSNASDPGLKNVTSGKNVDGSKPQGKGQDGNSGGQKRNYSHDDEVMRRFTMNQSNINRKKR